MKAVHINDFHSSTNYNSLFINLKLVTYSVDETEYYFSVESVNRGILLPPSRKIKNLKESGLPS